ncbi:MAG: ABC transporter ATP-binding protein [Oscillospiraceae bacterium]|nr:ABC transporter ATP-binding protein [Oscillospiraceae bacterium]
MTTITQNRPPANDMLLEVENLSMFFPIRKGFFNRIQRYVKAVDDVSFNIKRGETVGLVGESGCGKSTVGNCLTRLLDPTGGKAIFHIQTDREAVDIAKATTQELHNIRKNLQMVFQDPYSSLNPRMTARTIISEPLMIYNRCPKSEIDDVVAGLMEKVGLSPNYMNRYPHAFSGGQRQRISIAKALSLNPQLMICDEAVSSLDVSVQAQILELLEALKPEFDMSYLFIAHDLSTVKHISDRVIVMYVGKIVEIGETDDLFTNPKHPYTEALLGSVPRLVADKTARKNIVMGEVPDPSNPPSGCYFHPRCQYAIEDCKNWKQSLCRVDDSLTHMSACLRSNELALKGV